MVLRPKGAAGGPGAASVWKGAFENGPLAFVLAGRDHRVLRELGGEHGCSEDTCVLQAPQRPTESRARVGPLSEPIEGPQTIRVGREDGFAARGEWLRSGEGVVGLGEAAVQRRDGHERVDSEQHAHQRPQVVPHR